MQAKITQAKRDLVSATTNQIENSDLIAIIDTAGVPADAFLRMRADLRKVNVSVKLLKKTLLRRSWADAGLDSGQLNSMLSASLQPAIVFTNGMNSFELYNHLDATRTGRAAKEGDVADRDIVVEAHDTGLPPGPIVGELNSIGIPAKIMKGSVLIQKDVTPIHSGETFSSDLGLMLDKLGIRPIEIGLILKGTFEDNTWFKPDILAIDYEQFSSELTGLAARAFNLACNIAWASSATIPTLIAKASSEALSLAIESHWLNKASAPHILGLAQSRMLALAGCIDADGLDEDLTAKLGAVVSSAPAAVEETTAEKVEETEEEEDEEASFAGLGDLFG